MRVAEETIVSFKVEDGHLKIIAKGNYQTSQPIEEITIMGLQQTPRSINLENNSMVEWDERTGTSIRRGFNIEMVGEQVVDLD